MTFINPTFDQQVTLTLIYSEGGSIAIGRSHRGSVKNYRKRYLPVGNLIGVE